VPTLDTTVWRVGFVGLALAYVFCFALAASVFFGNFIVGGLAALTLLDAPMRIRRWIRTQRAFAALPRYKQQQLAGFWWLAAFLGALLLLAWLRGMRHTV
jgi:hypothetical protein